MVETRFCTSCGAPFSAGASFCSACGSPAPVVSVPASPAQAAPAQEAASTQSEPMVASGERVVSVIPNAMLKGGFLGMGGKSYTLVLTNTRIIFAQVTSEMMKRIVADARDGAKAEGKGFFGQWGAQLSAYSRFAQGYFGMAPDAVAAESPENFSLPNTAIVKASLKAGQVGDADTSSTPDRLIIKATDRKYVIHLNAGVKQAREALIAAALI